MTDYLSVTELAGDEVSREQVKRLCERYYWAGEYCRGKDVLELGCGPGLGLGYLGTLAKNLTAGDISERMVEQVRHHYGKRVDIRVMDAQNTGMSDSSCDVVILFEAIYYLPEVDMFLRECRRLLRPGGYLLIVTANKDLYDFNPSPHSVAYYNVVEMGEMLARFGFSCKFYGGTFVGTVSFRQRLFRPIKAMAVRLNLMPRTMAGKRFLKRLIFGEPIPMPPEIEKDTADYTSPDAIPADALNASYKVLYCAAQAKAG